MTTFTQFVTGCKMRHDFADRIQVRYRHHDGQEFDTWVSGEEALQRLQSEDAEQRLRQLGDLTLDDLRALGDELPEAGKETLHRSLRERLSQSVDETLGDSILAESLADLVSGGTSSSADEREQDAGQKRRWLALLHERRFRAIVLELAYVQLEGSLPEDGPPAELADWVSP